MWQLTEKKSVCGTGDSPLAVVLEHLEVYGNENSLSPRREHWTAVVDRYAQRCAWCKERLEVCTCGLKARGNRAERRAARRVALISAGEL